MADDEERKPGLLAWLRGPKPIMIEDVPWLVKDFNVLYATALRVLDEPESEHARTMLGAQLLRLKPAYTQTQLVRADTRRK